MRKRPFRRVGEILPGFVMGHFRLKLQHAGIREDVRVWVGERALLAFLCGALFLSLYITVTDPLVDYGTLAICAGLFLCGNLLVISLAYLQLYYRMADRTSTMERILPDFLLLTVSNLRAGMSPFAAFVQAALPDFGAFYEEVKLSTAKTGGKSSLEDTLSEISGHFDSHILQRTVSLFTKGLRSGGHLARLLNSIAQEVRRIQDLRAELASSTRAYTIFLTFILVLVMPFLLSVSTLFVTVFLKINAENSSSTDISTISNLPAFSGAILISEQDMVLISLIVAISTSFFMSVLVGVILKGRATYGIKYFPFFACAAVLMYLASKLFLGAFLSGFAS